MSLRNQNIEELVTDDSETSEVPFSMTNRRYDSCPLQVRDPFFNFKPFSGSGYESARAWLRRYNAFATAAGWSER